MLGQEIIYAPCPCGSGKKFKFCCYKQYRDELSDDMTLADIAQKIRCAKVGITDEARPYTAESGDFHDRGIEMMHENRIPEARELFKKSRTADPINSAAWNNEASCAWEMGDYQEAYEIQREGNAQMPFIDSFGLAQLALYAHALDRETESEQALTEALAVPPVSVFGALSVCKTLAIRHRHQDILDYVTRSGMADSPNLAFFTGVAHANLDQMGQARIDLERSGDAYNPFLVTMYLGLIADDVCPWTPVSEDAWSYFSCHNFAPARTFVHDVVLGNNPFEKCPKTLIEDCIVCAMLDNSISTEDALTLAKKVDTPRARNMANSLEDMLKSIAESAAEEDAARAADVDSNGKPRIPFCDPNLADERAALTEDERELIHQSYLMTESDTSPESDAFIRMENAMRTLADAYSDAPLVNLAYFNLLEKHDPKLAHGLMESFCLRHAENSRCGGTLLMLYGKRHDYAKAAQTLDRYALPREPFNLSTCPEWAMALALLGLDPEFKKSYPEMHKRTSDFLNAFSI